MGNVSRQYIISAGNLETACYIVFYTNVTRLDKLLQQIISYLIVICYAGPIVADAAMLFTHVLYLVSIYITKQRMYISF